MNFIRTRAPRAAGVVCVSRGTRHLLPRDTYAEPVVPGIEGFLHHEGFREAARRVYGRPVVVPEIAYANLLVPGQELLTAVTPVR